MTDGRADANYGESSRAVHNTIKLMLQSKHQWHHVATYKERVPRQKKKQKKKAQNDLARAADDRIAETS